MGSPVRGWSRRAFLASGMAACGMGAEAGKGALFPSDWQRYSDPATEFQVYRLTNPAYSSFLPAYYGRSLAHHNGFFLFWSDRAGAPQAFRMELPSGQWRQLTDARELDGSTLTLMPGERACCYFDGPSLRHLSLTNLREHEIYRVPENWQRTEGASVSDDGTHAVFAESQKDHCRLRIVGTSRGGARSVIETAWNITHAIMHPRRDQILYRQADEALWLVNADGRQNRRLKLADGRVGPARWSPGGRSILYLNFPEDKTQLHALREHFPDQNTDKLVAKTSQFVHFGCNVNSSVFVGSSENKASPYILLLLRITRRELTLCEHRASDASKVAPMFSPDSQRVYFQSDRHGKPAVYMMRVDKFVEKTDSGT